MNSAKSPAEKSWLQTLIKNKNERKKVIFIFTISFLLVVAGLIYIPIYKHSLPLDSKIYEGNFKELGSIARIDFFAALAIYPIFSQVCSSVARSHCSYINGLDYFTWLYGFNKRISSKFYVLFRNYYDGCSSLFTRDGREAL
ncbi:hypothetical protein [Priestia aryabhattai]|uniref:hypothetical protein n=1 Tax=Priestia aryabhattai TaxID=412384 RepID=UPI0027E3DB06|nr:hypothetical protein [Priestia aryabhattai]